MRAGIFLGLLLASGCVRRSGPPSHNDASEFRLKELKW